MIEDKIKNLQLTKNNSLFNKYNLEEIVKFVNTKLANLPKTYENSSLPQKKTLLSSIIPTGVTWNYPGLSNQEIGLLYRSILNFTSHDIHSSTAGGTRTPDTGLRTSVFYPSELQRQVLYYCFVYSNYPF